MTEERKSAPFSSHSRGVPLFDKNRISDAQRELASALLDLRDIGSSIFWFLSMQSWVTLWSVIINIVSGGFWCTFLKFERVQMYLVAIRFAACQRLTLHCATHIEFI